MLLGLFRILFLVSPARGAGLFLCPERQRKQNALLCHRSERSHNHRQSSVSIDLHSTLSAHLCGMFGSILIGDYSISVLCFLGSLFPNLCLKESFIETSPLVSAFTKLSQSSFTLRCLTSLPSFIPTFDGRCYVLFFGYVGVGLLFLTKLSVCGGAAPYEH